MNTLLKKLESANRNGPIQLMTHVVLGYPSLEASIDIVKAMADAGASYIELQIPFSDPMADGPTIMRACEHALAIGTTPRDCMHAMEMLNSTVTVPLLFMSYFNILYRYGNSDSGVRAFVKDAAAAGAQGLIVPDVPVEEDLDGYWSTSRECNIIPIPLVSPVSSSTRLAKIAAAADSGFVYCVSTTGTTGARKDLPDGLPEYLGRIREYFSTPLAVGFGISTPQHLQALAGIAEIAIVGSAMIDRITAAERPATEAAGFVETLLSG